MKWSWKIGQIAGIDLRMHVTFLLLLGWVGASYWMQSRHAPTMLAGLGFILALFACVLLHELGHALAAREFGIRTKHITLLPIGGLAQLERMPEEPKQELWIALTGPAVNVLIASVLYGWLVFAHQWEPFSQLGIATGPFIERLFAANVWLVLFNLIPAFPMDGGRVLRALLAMRWDYFRATRTAAWIGQGFAFVFGVLGLFTNPMLLLIGVFVWISARQEAAAVETRSALAGAPAFAAMLTDFETLHVDDTLGDAVYLTLKGSQRDFAVTEHGHVIGMLTRSDLLAALAQHGQDQPVTTAMRREFHIVESAERLETVLATIEAGAGETIPVIHEGRLIGLITMDNLRDYLLINAILEKRGIGRGFESHPARTRRAS